MLRIPKNERERAQLAEALRYRWDINARDKQKPPVGDWFIWIILAGRGFGKTRTGAEQVRIWVKDFSMVNLIGATADDAIDIMIEGESGILAICPRYERPLYKKSDRRLDWPNGAKSLIFTADEPERLRGKQHMKVWADELGSWRYPESWDQAMMGLRLGNQPQGIVTTTPRPTKLIKVLMTDPRNAVTRGTTYENRANLARGFFDYVIKKYEGTRLGRQELNAEVLEDVPGALWKQVDLDNLRVEAAPELFRIVIGVDPEVSSNEDSAETGIIAAGLDVNGHAYVLEDGTVHGTPGEWAKAAADLYHRYMADLLVGEVNNGGEMVGFTVLTVDPAVNYKAVHASKGKYTRAEPISAKYEKGLVHHVGYFEALETQMCNWVPGNKSPDRMDALVWALTMLFYEPEEPTEEIVTYEEDYHISDY
jgi:phage terminase large subunit-like protein